MTDIDRINVGEICGTHGLSGEIKILPLTDFPERFNKMKQVWMEGRKHSGYLEIVSVKPHKQFLLMRFKGYETPEAAATLTGGLLMVPKSEAYPLPPGSYYIFQLIGLTVYDTERGLLGKLTDVLETGANDVYVIQDGPYGEVLLPAIKDVIKKIDLEAGRIDVVLLPGLLDED
ncbi:MAG: ribosome maturation factor RimM [Solirubrobacterales bacterium]